MLAVGEDERQRMLQLVQDFPALWHAPTTAHADRKQLVRYLIQDVTLSGFKTTIQLGIRWHSGAATEHHIPRGTQRTAEGIIEAIRQAVQQQHSDTQIAVMLNARGWTTARCHAFTAARIKVLRCLYHIPRGDAKRPDRLS